jgi:hypothetical protein
LVLAILRPDLMVSVCDSVAKKARVLDEIAGELGLPVTVHAARVQDVLGGEGYHTLTARGVAPLWKLMSWLGPHRASFGRLLVVKGPAWIEERAEARHRGTLKGFDLRREGEYTTPRTTAVSTILSVTPKAVSDEPALRDEEESAPPRAKGIPGKKIVAKKSSATPASKAAKPAPKVGKPTAKGGKRAPATAAGAKKKRYPRPWDKPSRGGRGA